MNRVRLEDLLFLPNVPAGMDWSVVGHWVMILRKSNEPADPIAVERVVGTSFYRVIDGRHRVIAAYMAGRTEIECSE